MTTTAVKRPFGRRDLLGYALGDAGCGFSFQLVGTYMQLFFFQCIGIDPKHYAAIILISKIWDAVDDVIIGGLIDRKRISRKSKYMPWIIIGAAGLLLLTITVFAPVTSLPYPTKLAWCFLSYLLWSVSYTFANVPYGSLHSVITDDPNERNSLSTMRSIGAGIAAVAVIALPGFVYKDSNASEQVLDSTRLFIVTVVFSVLTFIALFATTRLVTERVEHDGAVQESVFASVKTFFTSRPMVGATLATVACVALFNSTASVNNLVFQYFFKDAQKTSLASIASYIPLILLMPFIGRLARRYGKKRVIALTSLISFAASVVLLFLPIEPSKAGMAVYVLMLMLICSGNCVFQITVWAIVADCIEDCFKRTGCSEEGSLYALYSFFRKLSQGIGQAVVSVGLAAIGFVSGENAVQPENFGIRVKQLYIVLLLLGSLLTFVFIKYVYNLNDNGEKQPPEGEPAGLAKS